MNKRSLKVKKLLPAVLLILSAAVFVVAQQQTGSKHNVRPDAASPAPNTISTTDNKSAKKSAARYFYEFTQPDFYVRHILIEHDTGGTGKITFERHNEETSFEEPLDMSPETLARIVQLWGTLGFIESNESYQSERQYPHLGTMKLRMELGEKKRTAEFNWTNNKDASALVNEYRRIADQAILLFDISIARENQPLNMPKLMDEFELQLRRNGLSDPKQLVPLLTDISTDEHLPLIARNHALRLIKKIGK